MKIICCRKNLFQPQCWHSKYPNNRTELYTRQSIHLPERAVAYLTNDIKDSRLELFNIQTERSPQPFIINRENFLFASTSKDAVCSAVMFSLIQTALENGLILSDTSHSF